MNLRTELAAYEHERWSRWQTYLFAKSTVSTDADGKKVYIIPADLAERWERQMITPYDKLSETEQASDDKEADAILKIVGKYLKETLDAIYGEK